MNTLKIFDYGGKEVRTSIRNGNPWFVAKDICFILGIANPRDAVGRLDDDEKGVVLCDTPGGRQKLSIVNESGLYLLIFGSRKLGAKKFKRWMVHTVLPTIRKTGGYVSNSEMFVDSYFPEMDTIAKKAFIEALESKRNLMIQNDLLMKENVHMRPKAEFFDAVSGSKGAIEMSKVAKVLDIKGFGRNKLFAFLREQHILREQSNEPYQTYVDRGYFRVIEQKWDSPSGETFINIKTLVFQKGLDFIRRLIKNIKYPNG